MRVDASQFDQSFIGLFLGVSFRNDDCLHHFQFQFHFHLIFNFIFNLKSKNRMVSERELKLFMFLFRTSRTTGRRVNQIFQVNKNAFAKIISQKATAFGTETMKKLFAYNVLYYTSELLLLVNLLWRIARSILHSSLLHLAQFVLPVVAGIGLEDFLVSIERCFVVAFVVRSRSLRCGCRR